jgi:hypothetical protein
MAVTTNGSILVSLFGGYVFMNTICEAKKDPISEVIYYIVLDFSWGSLK